MNMSYHPVLGIKGNEWISIQVYRAGLVELITDLELKEVINSEFKQYDQVILVGKQEESDTKIQIIFYCKKKGGEQLRNAIMNALLIKDV